MPPTTQTTEPTMPVARNAETNSFDKTQELLNKGVDALKITTNIAAAELPKIDGNVVDNYRWAVSYKKDALSEVPRLTMTEYQINVSSLASSVQYWLNQGIETVESLVAGDIFNAESDNPYKGLYHAKPTGQSYIFPFYAPYHHQMTNNWSENKGPLGETIDAFIANPAKLLKPSAGIETAKAWQGTNAGSFEIKFQLLNTVEDKDIEKNQALIKQLLRANMPYRINAVTQLPPVIYTVAIPGVRYSPAAVISNMTVANLGQINFINGKNIPDAFEVQLQITELIVESRQIFDAAINGDTSKVTAIMESPPETQEVGAGINGSEGITVGAGVTPK